MRRSPRRGIVDTGRRSDLAERAVAVVAVEPIGRRRADEEIEIPVMIQIGEDRGRRIRECDGGRRLERVVALVVMERAVEEVDMAVIVVISLSNSVYRWRGGRRDSAGDVGEAQRVHDGLGVPL
jgi:hypothetical protein